MNIRAECKARMPDSLNQKIATATATATATLTTVITSNWTRIIWSVAVLLLVLGVLAAIAFRSGLLSGDVRVVGVTTRVEQKAWSRALRQFEKHSRQLYPLGDHESFYIDHGHDYFAFFRRMSPSINMRLCIKADRQGRFTERPIRSSEEQVVGAGCGVLRKLAADWRRPAHLEQAWYICDLRILEAYRGRRLPFRMLLNTVVKSYLQCGRCFGITMHPAHHATAGEGKVSRLAGRVWAGPVHLTPTCVLLIYSLDCRTMKRAQRILEAERGPLGYRSTDGVKRLVVQSTGKAMSLLHVNFHRFDRALVHVEPYLAEPKPDFQHMFCLPETDPLVLMLDAHDVRTDVRATVLAYGMNHFDFCAIQTSEI